MLGTKVPRKAKQPSTFGQKLRALRIGRGLTQEQLAAVVGMRQNVLSRLENSPNVNPSWETVQRLAKALDVTPNEFVDPG